MVNIGKKILRKSKLLSRKGLYDFLGEQYGSLSNNSKILLVGSGGEIADHLNTFTLSKKFIVTAIDIDEKRKPDITGDICITDFNDKKFDAVVVAEVLEHVHSPQKAIANIFRVLNKNGKVILTVPFIFPIHDKPNDYYRFTRYGLELLLKKFSSIKIRGRNNWGEAIAVLMVRHVILEHTSKYFIVILGFVLYPLLKILGILFKTDAITTGYCVVAYK